MGYRKLAKDKQCNIRATNVLLTAACLLDTGKGNDNNNNMSKGGCTRVRNPKREWQQLRGLGQKVERVEGRQRLTIHSSQDTEERVNRMRQTYSFLQTRNERNRFLQPEEVDRTFVPSFCVCVCS